MKKKNYTRPVSVMISVEMFEHIKTLTDSWEISVSDYIRLAIHEMLKRTNDKNGGGSSDEK